MNAHRGSAVLSSATFKLQPTATGLTENHRLRLFSGSSNVQLSQEVARYLGMDLGPMIRKRFAMVNCMFKFRNRFGVAMSTSSNHVVNQ